MVKEKVAEATTEDKTSQKTTDKQGKSQEDKPTTDLRDTTKEQDNKFNFHANITGRAGGQAA